MDYKYIEQLIESYFNCQTSLQEEQILRSFFSQEDVPGHLAQYADLFRYETDAKEEQLGEDFDAKMMECIEKLETADNAENDSTDAQKTFTKRIAHFRLRRFAPFFKAAAIVAIALTIGRATEHAIGEHEAEEKNATAVDTYIKTKDIQQIILVKDESQAEIKTTCDTILSIANSKGKDGI